ncbi:MAG TPA: hypothetical protein VIQ30_20965 [Pseudonocardia sp.]
MRDLPSRTLSALPARLVPTLRLCGAFFHIWGRVGLMSALAVIFMSVLTKPAPPGREVPATVGIPHTLSTPLGVVEIGPIKVFSTGAIVDVHAELTTTPDDLLASPEQVLAPAPEHADYAMTLHTRTPPTASTPPLPVDFNSEPHPHQWRVSFWVPRAAWSESPRLVWPVAHLDMPLQLSDAEMEKATLVIRTRDQ